MNYMLGDYGGGDKFWVFEPLSNFIRDNDDLTAGSLVDLTGLRQETAYSVADPENLAPEVSCDNADVMLIAMHETEAGPSDRAYFYVKNQTVYWYQVLDHSTGDPAVSANITIGGLVPGTYTLERWRTTDGNPSTQVVARDSDFTVDSSGIASLSGVTLGNDVGRTTSNYAWAYKLEKN